MMVSGVVTGRVTNEDGEPMVRAQIVALQRPSEEELEHEGPSASRKWRPPSLWRLTCESGTPSRQPPGRRRYFTSQHFYAFHVNGIAFDVSGDGHVMAFMSLECLGVVDGQDFVIAVGDH